MTSVANISIALITFSWGSPGKPKEPNMRLIPSLRISSMRSATTSGVPRSFGMLDPAAAAASAD